MTNGQQLTEEDLAKMSPEEIAELQKQQCIFCHIVSGKVPSKKVYEDDDFLAILDINPANPGHVLLMPKEHYSIMPQMPEDIVGKIFVVAKHISQAVLRALQVQGTYIMVANGVAAGQKAAHFMIHVIPRKEGDGLTLDIPEHPAQEAQLNQIREALAVSIEKSLGPLTEQSLDKQNKIEMDVSKEEEKEPEVKIPKEDTISEKPKNEIELSIESNSDLDAISALVTGEKIPDSNQEIDEAETLDEITNPKSTNKFVSSEKSDKFHALNCPFAQNIKEENRIYYDFEPDDKKPCRCVNEL